MIKLLTFLLIINISFTDGFKSDREIYIEKNIIAPCCLGGSIHGHDDNTYTIGIKALIHELTQEKIDNYKIFQIFNDLYKPSSGMYQVDLPPIISINEIEKKLNSIGKNISDQEILNIFSSIHGNQILSDPPSNVYAVWLIPLIFFFIGIIFIFSIIQRKNIK